MPESVTWLLSCAAGAALGAAFFAALWWTLRRSLSAQHPALWILGSLLARTALLLTGFYFVADGHWQRLLACVLGFVMAKFVATRLALPSESGVRAP